MARAEAQLSPRDIVSAGLCIGCGACAGARTAMAWNRYGQLEPMGTEAAQPSHSFMRLCPFSPAAADEDELAGRHFPAAPHRDAQIGRFHAAYVGHAAEGGLRAAGSSGGMVTWTAQELLRRGLADAVVHVAPALDGPLFRYRISRTEEQLHEGSRSRYYPVELSGVVAEMRTRPGRYIVIGIPCFIKAIRLLCARDPVLHQRVAYTLGLFCGHMKSARMAESFAWQMGVDPLELATIDFRLKDPQRPANWYRAELTSVDGSRRAKDWWHLADGDWGCGFFQSAACDYCDDVVAETADIAFGDAWLEPYSSDGRGTNVVITRSAALDDIVKAGNAEGRLALSEVGADFVRRTQEAGFRQRREGLAYRLSLRRRRLMPRKRVHPCGHGIAPRRKLVYRMRASTSRWSHRIFWLARLLGWPALYILWARATLGTYRALTYSRGPLGRAIDGCAGLFSRRPRRHA